MFCPKVGEFLSEDTLMADERTHLDGNGHIATDEVLFPLTDQQGSVNDLAKRDAATGVTSVVDHIMRDSFGKVVSESDPSQGTLIGYTGRPTDKLTDIEFHDERVRTTGSPDWMSEDPTGEYGGDVNTRRYCFNSPTNMTDPSGLAPPGEADYKKWLNELMQQWRKDDWGFAASLLEAFLNKTKSPSFQKFKHKVNNDGSFQEMLKDFFSGMAMNKANGSSSITISVKGTAHLRFEPAMGELFWALGGFDLLYDGKLTITTDDWGLVHWEFRGHLQIEDDYQFPDVGWRRSTPYPGKPWGFPYDYAYHLQQPPFNYPGFKYKIDLGDFWLHG